MRSILEFFNCTALKQKALLIFVRNFKNFKTKRNVHNVKNNLSVKTV